MIPDITIDDPVREEVLLVDQVDMVPDNRLDFVTVVRKSVAS